MSEGFVSADMNGGTHGPASNGGSDGGVDRLLEGIDRLAAGERDVSFPTDRDDDVGRVADALADLAESLRDGEREASAGAAAGRSRREPERELAEYRAYTEEILDAIDDVFYVVDADGALQRWNRSLTEVTGYADEEVAEMHATDFFDPGDAETIASTVREVFETGDARVEVPIRTRDGQRVPFEFAASRLEDPDGEPVLVGVGRDIGERLEREREAREHREKLSRLTSNVPGYVYRARNEPDWPVEFVSAGVEEILGCDPGALERGEVEWGEDVTVVEGGVRWEDVQATVDEGEPFKLTYEVETVDGERRWLKDHGRAVAGPDGEVEAIEGVVVDVTERVESEAALARTRELFELAQRLGAIGGWEVDLSSEPPALTWTDEVYRIHDLPVGEDVALTEAIEYYHPADRRRVGEAVARAIESGEEYDVEARLVTAAGDERWVRSIGRPVTEDGEVVALRGSIQDVTEKTERELALHSLHDAARELLTTESEREVAEVVTAAAAEQFDVPGVAVYLVDEDANRLVPRAASGGFAGDGDPPTVTVGDDDAVWQAFVRGEPLVVADGSADGADAAPVTDDGLLLPLDEHGVFVVATDGPADDETRRLVETLVATTEAALDRLDSEAALRERDAELAARNRRLRRQVAINEIIRRVDQSLVAADTREEVETAVCERLVESDDVSFAWIGGLDHAGERVVPRRWAGADEGYLDAVSLDVAASAPEPAVRTADAGEPTVVPNVVDGFTAEGWRRHALSSGYHSVVTVPLSVGEFSHGVLAVYADEPGAFSDLERTVFAELGQSIANAIDAVQARAALHADRLLELTLELDEGDTFLARVARAADCEVEYEGIAARSGDETRLFFATGGAAAGAVERALEDLLAVRSYRLVGDEADDGGRRLFEATVSGPVLPARLVRLGARPRSVRATPTGTTVVVEAPAATDVREFVERLRDAYPSLELVGRRDVERAMETRESFVSGLFEELTDRQVEVLRTAYFAGFFEWPRRSTGEEVAEILGITQPTVNRHLRLAQGRLLAQLFEGELPGVVTT